MAKWAQMPTAMLISYVIILRDYCHVPKCLLIAKNMFKKGNSAIFISFFNNSFQYMI